MKPRAIHCAVLIWIFPVIGTFAATTRAPLPSVGFSVPRGLHERPFHLELTSPRANASVRYTLDGSEPTANLGLAYLAPLLITNTTLLRAAAFQGGIRVLGIGTHSYLFLEQILRQSAAPAGLPSGPKA